MAYDSPPLPPTPETFAHGALAAGLGLATPIARDGQLVRVRLRWRELSARLDASVDPRLVDEAQARGARVVVEPAQDGSWLVVGVLMTARALEIDREGNVDAKLRSFVLQAEGVLLKTPHAFLRLRERASELFAGELVLRGRLLTRILGKTIKLN